MGDRYIIPVKCPKCGGEDKDVYYAPTCGFTFHKCTNCGLEIDLEVETGISYEEASNRGEIEKLVQEIRNRKP